MEEGLSSLKCVSFSEFSNTLCSLRHSHNSLSMTPGILKPRKSTLCTSLTLEQTSPHFKVFSRCYYPNRAFALPASLSSTAQIPVLRHCPPTSLSPTLWLVPARTSGRLLSKCRVCLLCSSTLLEARQLPWLSSFVFARPLPKVSAMTVAAATSIE